MSEAMVKEQDRYEAEMAPIWDEDERRIEYIRQLCEKGEAKISDLQDEIRDYANFCDENNLQIELDAMFEVVMNFKW